jgi:PAS domain S-box-containing protein
MSAEIDVFAYPEPVALKIAREAGIEDRLKLAKEPLTEVKRGIAVQKGNMALLAKLDPAVKTFLATDAYRNIYTKWFGKPKPYWTVARVTWDMLGIIVVLIVGMLWWRNRVAARMIQASRMGEKQFKGMFEHVGVGFAQTSLDGRFLLVNDRFVDIVGHDRDALLSLSFKEITYSEDLSIDIPAMKDLVDGRRQNYNTEKRYIRADGGVVWVSLTVVMVRDDVGEPDYFLAVIENITERKQIEREAVEKSALLETTIATMAQGYVFYNADFQLVAFNAQYERMFEFSPDFLRPGMPMEDVVRNRITRLLGLTGSSNEDRIQGHIERAKNIRELTEERSLPNGLTYVYHRKPLPEGGFMTTYTDITALKQGEQKATEQSHLIEATFESMAQGVAVYDSEATLVAFNGLMNDVFDFEPGFLKVGMKHEEVIRYRAKIGYYGEENKEEAIKQALLRTKNNSERTLEVQTAAGKTFIYHRRPMPNGGYINTFTDITEQKQAEEKLQQAQKMEAVGQLTGGVAHDFNNLLAVSIGNVELAQEAAESGGDVRPYLATILRASDRGAALTNQLLAFSRKQTLFPKAINAGELMRAMTGLLRSALGETIKIKLVDDEDLWPCKVDPHQLESAILNLAINARDSMPSGGMLTIQATNVSIDDDYAAAQVDVAQGAYVMIAVSDTGTGMPKDVIDHVFDPFFTTKDVGQGSGLGLSMVYGFVKQSGGQVTIYSEVEKGTTIKLYLPRSDGSELSPNQEEQEDAPQARGETILVVEDDPDVLTVRRHIKWNIWRPDLREDLAHLVQDIKRRICGIASAEFPLFSV